MKSENAVIELWANNDRIWILWIFLHFTAQLAVISARGCINTEAMEREYWIDQPKQKTITADH